MIALLDVNVLLALFWPRHRFHDAASAWFRANQTHGWATCTLSQAGFARLYTQRAITGIEIPMADALSLLADNCGQVGHEFWPHESSLSDLLPEIRKRIFGHKQVTDAILLDLAIRHEGRLATFDRGVERLLPANSLRRSSIELIPLE